MMNNHSVPDFEMDDDYALPTSSGLTRPKKSPMAEDEIMELLWQNGQVVMQSQNQRSLKKSHLSSGGGGGSGDAVIPSEQAAGREIRPVNETTTTTQQHMFMQEDEMASWLHYPLDDSSFDYADLLYPPPSAPITTAAPPPREFRTVEIRQPPPLPTQPSTASAPISVAQRPPPVPPARRTGGAAETAPPRFQNFGHFSRLPSRNSTTKIELPPSKSLKESTVVDSNDTPILESKFSNVADNIPAISAATAATSTVPVREPTETTATTCELTVTSSPGCSGNSVSASAEPPSQVPSQTTATVPSGVVAEDRKRKGRENDDGECQNEDAEFESADTKKQARCSTSTKRSRAAEVHNLSERRRRDRIYEKMRALQELIPRCNKTDKASMLDEAIEYLKSLQLQVQMMSMGCGMVPMMYPGMQQYIPTMGMGLGMGMGMEIGMNRPMVPYPPLLPGTAMQNAAAAAQMGPRFPMPPFHLQAVPVPDPSRVQTSNQPDPMLNPLVTHNPNHPRLQNYNDPYQQFFGLQAQVALPQNQAVEQPKNNRTGSSKEVGNPGNHQSG